jgi:phosphate transport system substrate-binding protein
MKPYLMAALIMAFATKSFSYEISASPQRPDGQRTPVDPAIVDYDPSPPLTGVLNIGGGYAPTPILEGWAALFKRAHPAVTVNIGNWGSTTAFGALTEERTQVCLLSREFMQFETDFMDSKRTHKDYPPGRLGVIVATGGYSSDIDESVPSMVVFIHKDNPLLKYTKGLTLAQLDAIFSSTRKRGGKPVTTWGDLGVRGDWADKPIHVCQYPMIDGIPNAFKIRVMQGGEYKETNLSIFKNRKISQTDPYFIMFGNRGHHQQHEDRDPAAQMVPLAETEAGPYSLGTFDEVRTRTYPLVRNVYLFVTTPPGMAVDPLAREYIRVALSQEGQREVARSAFMPLSAAMVNASLAVIH